MENFYNSSWSQLVISTDCFSHLFNKYLLSTYSVSDTVLVVRDTKDTQKSIHNILVCILYFSAKLLIFKSSITEARMLISVAVICHGGRILYETQFKKLCNFQFMKNWGKYVVFMIKWNLSREPKVN